jgi:REP element-mobilizing transposase RayT
MARSSVPRTRHRKPRRKRRPKQLGLSARGTWGGYRAGAGRPRVANKSYVPHTKRAKITKHQPVHVTLRCVKGLPSLRRNNPHRIIKRIFARESRKGFRLIHYAIRSNHIHLVCEANHAVALSRGIQRVASRIARALNKRFSRRGRFFADRFHDRVIKSPRDMRNVLRYVLLNEHKDQAKASVEVMGVDPYTSFIWFDGWVSGGKQPAPARGDPVVAPRCWLLRKGWRRHGRIRTDEYSG